MYVLSVSLLRKGFGLEELSYFSSENSEPGSIISVPLRTSSAKALVLRSEKAEDMKAEIRSSAFSLRKIESLDSLPFISPLWMKAVEKTAEYFASPLGSAVATLLPAIAIKHSEDLQKIFSEKYSRQQKAIPKVELGKYSRAFFQGSEEDRGVYYKSIIREEFAKKKSVFLCLSENLEIEKAKDFFEKGIEKHIFVFKPSMPAQLFLDQYEVIRKSKHPVLVIASPQWLFLEIGNLGTVIADRVEEGFWKTLSRPFLDTRNFLEFFAESLGIRLLLGESVFGAERLFKLKEEDPYAFNSLNFRVPTTNSLVIPMKKNPEQPRKSQILSDDLLETLSTLKDKRRNAFIFSARKGLSSVTVCRDCGTEVLCNNCSSPVVLYRGKEDPPASQVNAFRAGNFFRCHQCGETRSAQEVCKYCSSWRLLPLGVGVEKVREELERLMPDLKVFEINKEVTSTSLKSKKVAEKFYSTPGSVLLGTEMALGFLYEKVDFSIVASIDSLFAVPDYHIREKIFRLLIDIKALALDKFLIQLRNAERETVEMALSGNIMDFYNREIKERQELNYPPFSVFIKITCRGTRQSVKNEMTKLTSLFNKYNPAVFPSASEKKGAQYAENAVLKVDRASWPDPELSSYLHSLPPFFEVKVDPDNLL